MSRRGILLINLGTPQSPDPEDVGVYLTEFLLDPEVIDVSRLAREFLVRVIIVPFRKKKSAVLYKKIWTERGSPLAFHTADLAARVQERLPEVKVAYGFRYGKPSLAQAVSELEKSGVRDLVVLPLYPQFATSATRTTEKELRRLGLWKRFENVRFIPSFHLAPAYIQSEVDLIRPRLRPGSHVLFSYHSIPVRHIQKNHADCGTCIRKSACALEGDSECYRRQCVETTQALARELGLAEGAWSISFQSRLGRAEWLTPSTVSTVRDLAARGIHDLTVVNPGFTADCLETLEEVDFEIRELYQAAGGRQWTRVPCLNADPAWTERLANWLKDLMPLQTSEDPRGKTPSQPTK